MGDSTSTSSPTSTDTNKSNNNAAESNPVTQSKDDGNNKSNATTTEAFHKRTIEETQQRINDDAKSLKIPSMLSNEQSDIEEQKNGDKIGGFVRKATKLVLLTSDMKKEATRFGHAMVNVQRKAVGLSPSTSTPIYHSSVCSKNKIFFMRVLIRLLIIFTVPTVVTVGLYEEFSNTEDEKEKVFLFGVLLAISACLCTGVLVYDHDTTNNLSYDMSACFIWMYQKEEQLLSLVDYSCKEIHSILNGLEEEVGIIQFCNGIGPTFITGFIERIQEAIADDSYEWSTCLNCIKLAMEHKFTYDTKLNEHLPRKMSNEKLEKEKDFLSCIKQMIEVIPFIKDKSGNYIFSLTSKELKEMEETKKLDKCTVLWYKYLNQSYRKAVTNNVDVTDWKNDTMKKILNGPYNLDAIDVELTDYDYKFRFDVFKLLNMKDCKIIMKKDKK